MSTPLPSESFGPPYFVFSKELKVPVQVAVERLLREVAELTKSSWASGWIPRYKEVSRSPGEIHYEVEARQKPPGRLERRFPSIGPPRLVAGQGTAVVELAPFRWVEDRQDTDAREKTSAGAPVVFERIRTIVTILPYATGSRYRKEYYRQALTNAGRDLWAKLEKQMIELHKIDQGLVVARLEKG